MEEEDIDPALVFQALRQIAQLCAINLSLNHHYECVVSKVSDDTWARLFKTNPTWCDYYFQTPQQLLQRMLSSESAKEAFVPVPGVESPLEQTIATFERVIKTHQETVPLIQQLLSQDGQVDLDLAEGETEAVLLELLLWKVLSSETRARSFYGQGMLSLVQAGMRGNDEGYFRAASIDPAIQFAPAVAHRITREALVGRTAFADALQKAARSGPSKNIDKDLHQLRFILSLAQDFGLLKELTDADRYEFFCLELELYPDSGKEGRNAKAALCIFIDRWEKSLVV